MGEMDPTQRKFGFAKTRILAVILILLLLINLALLYFLFSSPKVTIINQSSTYKLLYKPSKPFSSLLSKISKSGRPLIKKTKSVNKIRITVKDKSLSSKSYSEMYGDFPEVFSVDTSNSTTDTAAFTLEVDPELAAKFSQKDLENITSATIISQLLYIFLSNKDSITRSSETNNYIKEFNSSSSHPFIFEKIK